MQIRIEKDDGEGKDKRGVRGVELGHKLRLALAKPPTEYLHESLNLLGFSGHPEVGLELSERGVDVHPREIHLHGEKVEHGHVELVVNVAQVLADHLLGQAFSRDQKSGHGLRGVLQKSAPYQVGDSFLRFLVENIQSRSVMSLPDYFIDCV